VVREKRIFSCKEDKDYTNHDEIFAIYRQENTQQLKKLFKLEKFNSIG
jgi:hypothetical protein